MSAPLPAHTPELPDPASFRPLLSEADFSGGPLLWQTGSLRYGGVERQIMANARALADMGVVPGLLCASLEAAKGETFFLDQARALFNGIHTLHDTDFSSLFPVAARFGATALAGMEENERIITTLFMARLLHLRPRMVQVWNADHHFAAVAAALLGVPRILLCARSQPTTMRAPHGFEGVNPDWAERRLHFLLRFPSVRIAANSRNGCRAYENWLGLSPGSVIHTPNAFVPGEWPDAGPERMAAVRRQLEIPPGAPLICGALRFSLIKDPVLWLRTVDEVLERRPEAHALLLGDGEMEAYVLRMAAKCSNSARIHVHPPVRDMGAVYAASNVFLLTSHVEGLPNVLLEAAYHRVPVVTTPAGGAPETVKDGVTGFVVVSRAPDRLAEKIVYILDNPEWAKKAGETARVYVGGAFAPRRTASVFRDLYADWGLV